MSEIEEIKSRLNIVDIVGETVPLSSAGAGRYKGLCPFHKEKTPSFVVDGEKQLWHCFGCSRGGDLFSFLMERDGLDFYQVLQTLAERAGVELSGRSGSAASGAEDKVFLRKITAAAADFYAETLFSDLGRKEALPYLRERGFEEKVLRDFRIGLAPDSWRALCDFLRRKGFAAEEIVAAGLAVAKPGSKDDIYDRFRGRVMFPISDVAGAVVGFSGRLLPSKEKDERSGGKYINTPESRLYDKSAILYGLNLAKEAIREKKEAVIVEGNADVLAMHQAGVDNTVAVSGTALTETQVRILRRYAPAVVLFFDTDTAGRAAAHRAAQVCLRAGLQVKTTAATGGSKDAADLLRRDPSLPSKTVAAAKDFFAATLDNLLSEIDPASPLGREKIISEFAALLAACRSVALRDFWTDKLMAAVACDRTAVIEATAAAGRVVRSETAPAREGKKPEKSVETVEENLLRSLLSICHSYQQAFRQVTEASLSPELTAAFPILKTLLERGEKVGWRFAELLRQPLPEEEKEMLQEAMTAPRVLPPDISEKEVSLEVTSLLRRLSERQARRRRAELIRALAQAEAAGDREEVKRLLRRLRETAA